MEIGQAVAGTPENVLAFLQSQLSVSAANYLVGQFALGDLSLAESLCSVELFSLHVMPALRAASRKPSDSDITPAKAPRR